jgi:hypothetical protein
MHCTQSSHSSSLIVWKRSTPIERFFTRKAIMSWNVVCVEHNERITPINQRQTFLVLSIIRFYPSVFVIISHICIHDMTSHRQHYSACKAISSLSKNILLCASSTFLHEPYQKTSSFYRGASSVCWHHSLRWGGGGGCQSLLLSLLVETNNFGKYVSSCHFSFKNWLWKNNACLWKTSCWLDLDPLQAFTAPVVLNLLKIVLLRAFSIVRLNWD